VGNPYASDIDFSSIPYSDRPNVQNRFWLWDSKDSGTWGIGRWIMFDSSTVTPWEPSVISGQGSYTVANSVIHSGMGLLVHGSTTGAGTLTIRENNKVSGSSNVGFRPTNSNSGQLHVSMQILNKKNVASEVDGLFALFNDGFSAGIDDNDAGKPENFGENLSLTRNGSVLTLEARPTVKDRDTLFMNMWNLSGTNYRFRIAPVNVSDPELSIHIIDKYKNTFTRLSNTDVTDVNFAVTSDAASSAPDRFMITMHRSEHVSSNINNDIIAFPNPSTRGTVNIQFVNQEEGVCQLDVLSITGRKMATETVCNPGGVYTYQLNTANLTPGNYFVRITKNNVITKSLEIVIR
jgi:hypothetical protein